MTGGLLGSFVHALFPDATASSGAYSLVAMGAVVAATTHAPITSIVMIFEMTQTITIIPPLMTSCVVSTLVATFLTRESIYTTKLARRGVVLRTDQHPSVLHRLHVRDVMSGDVASVPASTRLEDILRIVAQSPHIEFYVVDDRGDLVGAISLSDLRQLFFDQEVLRHVMVAGDLAVPNPPTVREDDDLDTAMQILGHSDLHEIAVVDAANPRRLIGMLTSQRMIEAYNVEVLRRDLAGGVSSTMGVTGRVRQVALGGGYVVQEIDAPLAFCGRSLRELEVGSRHGVHVVLIRTPSDPDPARRVRVPTSTENIRQATRWWWRDPRKPWMPCCRYEGFLAVRPTVARIAGGSW